MPTGYVNELITNKLDFPAFALVCTRAFGVCIMMRDDSLDTPIPEEFKPSDYHSKAIKKIEVKLARLKKLTGDERVSWGARELKKTIKLWKEYAQSNDTRQNLVVYEDMKKKVEAWKPPTKDHQPLKTFMLDQLESSARSDDHSSFYLGEVAKLESTKPLDYYRQQLRKAKDELAYHKKQHKEEVARVNQRNTWIRKLRESLK